MVRGFKFEIYKVEELYYLCSENKGTDQLHGYHTANLRLCFHIFAKSRFSHAEAHLWSLSTFFVLKVIGPLEVIIAHIIYYKGNLL